MDKKAEMMKKTENEKELKEENLGTVIGGQDGQTADGGSGKRLASGPCPTCPSRYNCKHGCSFTT